MAPEASACVSFVCVRAGGSLFDVIVKKEIEGKLFSEAELKDLLLQVSMGLKYIHSLGLVHLDIKPSMFTHFHFPPHIVVFIVQCQKYPFFVFCSDSS